MDNWKIQFMVVTFVAFLQTYEAASSAVTEERWLPEHWQVKSLFFEIAKNEVQKYQLGLKFHLFEWKFSVICWQHEAFNMAEVFRKCFEFEGFFLFSFLAELICIFLYFVLSERVRGGRSEPPDGKSNEKSQSPSLLWAHGKTFRYGKAHLWQRKYELIFTDYVALSGLKKPFQVNRRK